MWKTSRLHPLVREFRLGDIILVLCLLSLSVVSGVILRQVRVEPKYCIISVDGGDVYKLLASGADHLSEPEIVKVKGPLGESIVEVRDGGARMLDSPCPLKICVHQGALKSPNGAIICVPNRVMIRITGKEVVDAITW